MAINQVSQDNVDIWMMKMSSATQASWDIFDNLPWVVNKEYTFLTQNELRQNIKLIFQSSYFKSPKYNPSPIQHEQDFQIDILNLQMDMQDRKFNIGQKQLQLTQKKLFDITKHCFEIDSNVTELRAKTQSLLMQKDHEIEELVIEREMKRLRRRNGLTSFGCSSNDNIFNVDELDVEVPNYHKTIIDCRKRQETLQRENQMLQEATELQSETLLQSKEAIVHLKRYKQSLVEKDDLLTLPLLEIAEKAQLMSAAKLNKKQSLLQKLRNDIDVKECIIEDIDRIKYETNEELKKYIHYLRKQKMRKELRKSTSQVQSKYEKWESAEKEKLNKVEELRNIITGKQNETNEKEDYINQLTLELNKTKIETYKEKKRTQKLVKEKKYLLKKVFSNGFKFIKKNEKKVDITETKKDSILGFTKKLFL